MKLIFSLIGLFLFSINAHSQPNNAILFTENGERFQVVLNGVLQNTASETNVKMTELPADHYKCRILFEDKKLGYLDFNMFFSEQGNEVTWNIKKNNKGEYVTRFVSSVPIAEAPVSNPSQKVIIYSTIPAATTTTTTIQKTQTTSGAGNDDVNINMGVHVNGEGGNISIHASGMDEGSGGGINSSTTTTTIHTTTTTIAGSNDSNDHVNDNVPLENARCPAAVDNREFERMKESVKSKDFENTKLTIARQILKDNCLTASQVREILGLFEFENTRLDFAKYAYDRTYDISNYYKVNDAFQFDSSVDELNKYISSRK